MAEPLLQMHVDDHPMVVISHRVKPGCEAAFREWNEGIGADMSAAPGFVARQSIPPVPGVQEEWVSVFHFDTVDNLKAWIRSETRARWLQKALPLVQTQWRTKVVSRLEHFFGLLPEAEAPSVWKLTVVTELGLYPVVMAVDVFMKRVFPGMVNWKSTLISTCMCVSILAWPVMPLLTRLFRPWLQPGSRRPLRAEVAE